MTSQDKELQRFVEELRDAAGAALTAVVAHGATAHGERFEGAHASFLLIVLADLELSTLAMLRRPLSRWLKRGQSMPRLFTAQTIAQSADVFPMELSDIAESHLVLFGTDPFAGMQVDTQHLRLQLEREIREKLMRLQEAYAECKGRSSELKQLIAASYLAFVPVFRGFLRLAGEPVPKPSREVVARFCLINDLDLSPFANAEVIAHGDEGSLPFEDAFARYYAQLVAAVIAIDAHGGQE